MNITIIPSREDSEALRPLIEDTHLHCVVLAGIGKEAQKLVLKSTALICLGDKENPLIKLARDFAIEVFFSANEFLEIFNREGEVSIGIYK